MTEKEENELKSICKKMRENCLTMAGAAGGLGFHFGAAMSIIEIVAVLYFKVMNSGVEAYEQRDRFILSKGHGVPALYAALCCKEIISGEELMTFKGDDTRLYGHPCKNKELGIEFSSGSLRQGLSFGAGVAMALKRKGNDTSRVFVLLGDGECNEGSVWEAAMTASKYKLGNLTAIIDRNHLQYDGDTEKVMPLDSLTDKWKSFGWEAEEADGHDVRQLYAALMKKSALPRVVIADTIKGKGISFMENIPGWHFGRMTAEQEKNAWAEVTGNGNK